jgi:hypothetical protein
MRNGEAATAPHKKASIMADLILRVAEKRQVRSTLGSDHVPSNKPSFGV